MAGVALLSLGGNKDAAWSWERTEVWRPGKYQLHHLLPGWPWTRRYVFSDLSILVSEIRIVINTTKIPYVVRFAEISNTSEQTPGSHLLPLLRIQRREKNKIKQITSHLREPWNDAELPALRSDVKRNIYLHWSYKTQRWSFSSSGSLPPGQIYKSPGFTTE